MRLVKDRILGYLRNTDKLLWLVCLSVSFISCVLIRGILQSGYQYLLGIGHRNLAVQAVAIGLGLACGTVLSLIPMGTLKKAWVIHVPMAYLLVLLTFFIGVGAAQRPDDKRWLVVPSLDIWIQPAELLKISFILVFAYHLISVGDQLNRLKYLIPIGLHAAVPILLIHFQGDDGTALLIGAIAAFMLFMAGVSWKYIVGAAAAVAASLPLLWEYVLNEFQKQRILIIRYQDEADRLGWYYQQYQAKIATAMGGETGVGLLDVGHVYIPEMHTDFIFSFLCESFGFMGALGVLALMLCMGCKLLYNSSIALDQYGSLVCVGVFAMIMVQFVINVGMCLSLIPVIGNPFPFLSYGGSSTLTNYLGIGLVQAVYMTKRRGIFSDA